MMHSATTDTLDSVYLDPPVTEQDLEPLLPTMDPEKNKTNTEHVGLNFVSHGGANMEAVVEERPNDRSASERNAEAASDEQDELFFSMTEVEDTKASNDSPPTLSKYFGTDSAMDDPFASNIFDDMNKVEQVTGPSEQVKVESKQDLNFGTDEDLSKAMSGDLANLTLTDTMHESIDGNVAKQSDVKLRPSEDLNIESVDFELMLDANDTVETPVDIEGKDDFESFTADIADTEAMDALGMSPAAPSFMNEKNINEYFRQTSQTDSIRSLGLGQQISQSSGRSSLSADMGALGENSADGSDSNGVFPISSPAHVDKTETNLPTPDLTNPDKVPEAKNAESAEATPTHQPMFPPSTTLSPVDSPVHQPFINNTTGDCFYD